MHRAFCRTVSSLAKNKGLPPGPKSRYIVRMQNDAGQRLLALQRAFALFCVLLLFMFVGIVFLLSSKAYASGIVVRGLTENMRHLANTPIVPTPTDTPLPTSTSTLVPTPTNTPIIPTPTNTPIIPTPTNTPIIPTPTNTPIIPTPTNTPLPAPTNTPLPTPTNTPLPAPTNTPLPSKTPGTTPTTVAKPTSTSAAGVPLGGGTLGGSPQQKTPTPTPSPSNKPSGAGLPPNATNAVSTPTASTSSTYSSTTVAAQNNGKFLPPTMPEITFGSSVLGALAIVGGVVWRRRKETPMPSAENQLAQTQAAFGGASIAYAQTAYPVGSAGIVREDRASYQEDTTARGMERLPETPLPHQAIMDSLEPSLETIMEQAQMGLFALPDKDLYYQ